MRKLDKPTLSSQTVYNDCLSIVRNEDLKDRLEACWDLVRASEQELENKITKGEVYTIVRQEVVNANVPANEFKKLYTGRFVGHAVGRVHYDKLLLSAPYGICPLCGHRDVTTLDHYLPKVQYPTLAVVPINLVPACKDCNTGKLTAFPKTPEEETLHPYFDNIEGDLWLGMTVNQTNPITVKFEIRRPASWDDLLHERVTEHFRSFKIAGLYSTQAARELVGIRRNLGRSFNSGGWQSVQKFLLESGESWQDANLNSWQSVFYNGLAGDQWFCESGFNLIA